MRRSSLLMGILLPISMSVSVGQSLCNPCVDPPPVRDRLNERVAPDVVPACSEGPVPSCRMFTSDGDIPGGTAAHISPRRIAEMIRATGGGLADMTHDCGRIIRETRDGAEWMVSACSWGGRYPALLIEPAVGNPAEAVYVVAVTGHNSYELLAEVREPSPAASGLRSRLIEEFYALYERALSAGGP